MDTEQRVITPFETSVCAALSIIGVALAAQAPERREAMESTVKELIEALPADRSIIGGKSAHHIALEALIQNLFPERNR